MNAFKHINNPSVGSTASQAGDASSQALGGSDPGVPFDELMESVKSLRKELEDGRKSLLEDINIEENSRDEARESAWEVSHGSKVQAAETLVKRAEQTHLRLEWDLGQSTRDVRSAFDPDVRNLPSNFISGLGWYDATYSRKEKITRLIEMLAESIKKGDSIAREIELTKDRFCHLGSWFSRLNTFHDPGRRDDPVSGVTAPMEDTASIDPSKLSTKDQTQQLGPDGHQQSGSPTWQGASNLSVVTDDSAMKTGGDDSAADNGTSRSGGAQEGYAYFDFDRAALPSADGPTAIPASPSSDGTLQDESTSGDPFVPVQSR